MKSSMPFLSLPSMHNTSTECLCKKPVGGDSPFTHDGDVKMQC